jgi:THO complex subunit 2
MGRTASLEISQKAHLLHALLAVGCIPPAIQLLSLHPHLSAPYSFIADGIHRILHIAIEPIYAPHSPARNFDERFLSHCNAPKRRAAASRSASGTIEWLEETDRRSVRGYDPFPKQEINDRTVRFFLDDDFWKDDVPICQTTEDFFALVKNFLKFSGPRLGNDVSLMVKLARIGKAHFTKVDRLR